jgi:hypothetical protein
MMHKKRGNIASFFMHISATNRWEKLVLKSTKLVLPKKVIHSQA